MQFKMFWKMNCPNQRERNPCKYELRSMQNICFTDWPVQRDPSTPSQRHDWGSVLAEHKDQDYPTAATLRCQVAVECIAIITRLWDFVSCCLKWNTGEQNLGRLLESKEHRAPTPVPGAIRILEMHISTGNGASVWGPTTVNLTPGSVGFKSSRALQRDATYSF